MKMHKMAKRWQDRAELWTLVCGLWLFGLPSRLFAQFGFSDGPRLSSTTITLMEYIEGTFGALAMLLCGMGGVICSAIGWPKHSPRLRWTGALLLAAAVALFWLRTVIIGYRGYHPCDL